jgi:hypothetical protein
MRRRDKARPGAVNRSLSSTTPIGFGAPSACPFWWPNATRTQPSTGCEKNVGVVESGLSVLELELTPSLCNRRVLDLLRRFPQVLH